MPGGWERTAIVLAMVLVPVAVVMVPTVYDAYLAPDDSTVRVIPRPVQRSQPHPAEEVLRAWNHPRPRMVLAFSGQMYGYMQPCGCARPQVGGLERRYELLQRLRQAGWPVVGFDLGDLVRLRHEIKQGIPALADQSRLKYETTWRMLKELGWHAVGVGPEEILFPLDEVLGLALNSQPPVLISTNLDWPDMLAVNAYRRWFLDNVPLAVDPPAKSATSPAQPVTTSSTPEPSSSPDRSWRIACLSVINDSVVAELRKELPKDAEIIKRLIPAEQALFAIWPEVEKAQPHLIVLLHHGTDTEARQLAHRFGRIDIILSRDVADVASSIAESLPNAEPSRPRPWLLANRLLVRVGHKGKAIGLVAVRPESPTNGTVDSYRLDYRMVELTEPLELPPQQTNPVRELMKEYVYQVYARDFLKQWVDHRQSKHPLQLDHPEAVFVGSGRCAECHRSACQVWNQSKHSQAYAALIKYGEPKALDPRQGRIIGRNYDPECLICHTTGFEYRGGFRNERETPHLVANGCENCHGPASLHVQFPKEPRYSLPLRRDLGKIVSTCRACHDSENDPHFDFSKYWPQIVHKKD